MRKCVLRNYQKMGNNWSRNKSKNCNWQFDILNNFELIQVLEVVITQWLSILFFLIFCVCVCTIQSHVLLLLMLFSERCVMRSGHECRSIDFENFISGKTPHGFCYIIYRWALWKHSSNLVKVCFLLSNFWLLCCFC